MVHGDDPQKIGLKSNRRDPTQKTSWDEKQPFIWMNGTKLAGWWFQAWILCSISYMGCHPSHWRTHIFQDGYCTTNQIRMMMKSHSFLNIPMCLMFEIMKKTQSNHIGWDFKTSQKWTCCGLRSRLRIMRARSRPSNHAGNRGSRKIARSAVCAIQGVLAYWFANETKV